VRRLIVAATIDGHEVPQRRRRCGLLLSKGGLPANVLRIKPPMCLTKDDANFLVDTLDEALSS
jgi:alanine-glyoxylate transaminase/(R)-3-amino-2-methylpropionate-pyruvate transaminase